MKVIVNGDDLGYTMGINRGMAYAAEHGILRSTTALMNSVYIKEGVEMMKEHPEIGVGLHLNLSLGRPLTVCPSITNPETGLFYPKRGEVWTHHPDYEEIRKEWHAQMNAFIEMFGKLPDHIDSHHSVHDATPEALQLTMELAEEYHLPVRRYNRFTYVPDLFAKTKPEELIEILEAHQGEDIEIMAHCAEADLDLYRWSSWNFPRVQELDILCSDMVKKYIEDNGIELTNYTEAFQ